MTSPVLNTELLERAMEYAIEHSRPTEYDKFIWDQAVYRSVTSCGTYMCLAGITCELSSGQWITSDFLLYESSDDGSAINEYNGAEVVFARYRAQRLLGLTHDETNYLFDGGYNGADELRTRVKSVINGELR